MKSRLLGVTILMLFSRFPPFEMDNGQAFTLGCFLVDVLILLHLEEHAKKP